MLFNACCEDLASTRGLQMVAVASLGGAVLAVAQVIAISHDTLRERTLRNARELEEVHARLQYLAAHDSLTGLPNRQRFKDRLTKAITDTERHGRAIAIAVFDLDHFSAINHSLGHGVGDWLLTEVARRVTGIISNSTTLARLDGDEFAILIDNVAARLEAQSIAGAILRAFKEPLRVNGVEAAATSVAPAAQGLCSTSRSAVARRSTDPSGSACRASTAGRVTSSTARSSRSRNAGQARLAIEASSRAGEPRQLRSISCAVPLKPAGVAQSRTSSTVTPRGRRARRRSSTRSPISAMMRPISSSAAGRCAVHST